jgi:hypothetical protein
VIFLIIGLAIGLGVYFGWFHNTDDDKVKAEMVTETSRLITVLAKDAFRQIN